MAVTRAKRLLSARLIRNSGLFDTLWYRARYPDIVDLRTDPVWHYVLHGAAEQRDPSGVFDTAFYLSQYPDLDISQVNPLCHYIMVGEGEGAWPNPYFDPVSVRAQLGRNLRPGQSPLAAYLSLGEVHLAPSHRLCAQSYVSEHHLAGKAGVTPLSHRLTAGQALDPNALLSPKDSLIRITGMGGLAPFALERGHLYFHVADDDPYLIFSPTRTETFEPGHYRLSLSFSRPEETLLRAKLYFDYGAGFDEGQTIRPGFEIDETGTATALLPLNGDIRHIRLDPVDTRLSGDLGYGISRIDLQKISAFDFYGAMINSVSTSKPHTAKLIGRTVLNILGHGPAQAAERLRAEHTQRKRGSQDLKATNVLYQDWVTQFDTISPADLRDMAFAINEMVSKPTISIAMPVYNTPEAMLRECIDSVLDQTYPHWELCIADDNSPEPHIREILEEYESKDSRIKVVYRTENGHISRATNSAIDIASGDWIALLDHDDLLAPHALFCMADAINRNPHARMFYSDEDKVDLNGVRCDPYFKSDWNERLFFEQNMVCHLGVYDAALVKEIGGLRAGFEGSQDHDLVLRFVEHIDACQIVHIPHILYHWRIMPGSTALGAGEKSYALEAGIRALDEATRRRGINGHVEAATDLAYYRLKLEPPSDQPLVSIVIPTRDGMDVLEPCIRSVLEKTTYTNYEIIIVDNQSEKEETLAYFRQLEDIPNVTVLPYDDVFNYSAINNFAVAHSNGSLICLLNNDTEVISPDWLTEMVAELSRDGVGAVGAKLLYTDGTVQHAGVVLGVGGEKGVAGHGMLAIDGNAGGYFSYAKLAREASAVTAACLLTSRDIFEDVGGLNEDELRVAFNDVDFCLKIREAGHKIIWTPHALLYHHESKSRGLEDTPEKQKRFTGEVNYMLERWGRLLQQDPYYNPNLALDKDTYTLSTLPRIQKPWKN